MIADVVVIGAGPVGASVAWHLAARGCTSVVVLERATSLGEGSAGRATGGFRAQFGTEINVRLSLLSREALRRFEHDVGVDPGFLSAGYLFLARTTAQMHSLRDGLALQRQCGLVEAREIGPTEAAALNPHFRLDGVVGGTFCPTDGFVRPLALLNGWADDARRRGVRFELDCGPVAWDVETHAGGRRVCRVRFGTRTVATRRVVVAAGAWSGLLSAHGVTIPVHPERRQIAVTQPFDALPADMPMTIDCTDGFHLRVRDGRVLLLRPDATPGADAFDTTFDASWLDGLVTLARSRVPCLEHAQIDLAACRCGLYEMTPDKHALVGPVPEIDGLWLATGNSGHGVMHAPAIGRLIAEMILDGEARSLDARALRPERFTEGDPNPSTGVL
jgi:sarcosine oxidase subunit beta